MKYSIVCLVLETSLAIFDEPTVKRQIDEIFFNQKDKIKEKIFSAIKMFHLVANKEVFEEIYIMFKVYFLTSILNEALKTLLTKPNNYNILDNIIRLLTEENLENELENNQLMINSINFLLEKKLSEKNQNTLH